jgi:hypothetical protein
MKNKNLIGCLTVLYLFLLPFNVNAEESKNSNSFFLNIGVQSMSNAIQSLSNSKSECVKKVIIIPKYIPPAALGIGLNLEYKN